jgi:hypothetical protein
MCRNRGEIEPGPSAPFYRGTGNGSIFGALLAVPPILTHSLPNHEKRSDLIASMRQLMLSYKDRYLTVFIIFTSRALNSIDIQLKLCQKIQNSIKKSPCKCHASVIIVYCFISPQRPTNSLKAIHRYG